MKLVEHRAACALVAAALAMYAIGLGWGLPSGTGPERVTPWGHDDIMPLGPLSEAQELLRGGSLDRFLGYPLMQYGLVLGAYSPYLAWVALGGGLATPVGHYPYGLSDPGQVLPTLTLLARSVTLAMAGGTVAAAYALGLWLFGRRTGLLSALFVMGLYPMFYYSRTGNLDVPYLCWGAWGLAFYGLIVRRGLTLRRGAALGVFAALAAGTKDQAAALFLLLPALIVPLHLRRTRDLPPGARGRQRALALAVPVAAGTAAYALASGLVVSPARWWAHVRYILGLGPHALTFPSYPPTRAGYGALLAETAFWIRA
ncbi:MAG: ArnT family glycosyltransferase, partial [Myxococcota bacterium]